MNPELLQVLDQLPADEPRSRLEPYREAILRWRRQGRSYRRIQRLLLDHCAIHVSTSMLFKFVKTRSRPRQREIEPPLTTDTFIDRTVRDQPAVPAIHARPTKEEVAKQRGLLQAIREKPLVVSQTRKRFVYDPAEPLVIGQS